MIGMGRARHSGTNQKHQNHWEGSTQWSGSGGRQAQNTSRRKGPLLRHTAGARRRQQQELQLCLWETTLDDLMKPPCVRRELIINKVRHLFLPSLPTSMEFLRPHNELWQLRDLIQRDSSMPGEAHMITDQIFSLTKALRSTGLDVVESLILWRSLHGDVEPYYYHGTNYLEKMAHDLDFLVSSPLIRSLLRIPLTGNPFLVNRTLLNFHTVRPGQDLCASTDLRNLCARTGANGQSAEAMASKARQERQQ